MPQSLRTLGLSVCPTDDRRNLRSSPVTDQDHSSSKGSGFSYPNGTNPAARFLVMKNESKEISSRNLQMLCNHFPVFISKKHYTIVSASSKALPHPKAPRLLLSFCPSDSQASGEPPEARNPSRHLCVSNSFGQMSRCF